MLGGRRAAGGVRAADELPVEYVYSRLAPAADVSSEVVAITSLHLGSHQGNMGRCPCAAF